MAGVNLFTWLDALYNKKQPEGTPPIFMMHRFLAADRDLAPFARVLQVDLRQEPLMVFRTWQGLLPKGQGAPRFSYVAAKKPAAAEDLTIRMIHVLGERRAVVEEMQEVIDQAGHLHALYIYFGIEPPADVDQEDAEEGPPVTGGLLDSL